jgi:competence protein ComEA
VTGAASCRSQTEPEELTMWKIVRASVVALGLVAATALAFAAVDINKATQADLESVKGIGPAMSGKILDERKKSNFKDWDDFIVRVKGVGAGNAVKFSEAGLTVNGAAMTAVDVAKPGAVAKADKAAAKDK